MRSGSPQILLAAAAVALCLLGPAAGDEDGDSPDAPGPYALARPLHEGAASVPWHAAFSPDGRFLAIVESHPIRHVAVFDARTWKPLWRERTETHPGARRPVFVPDGESLVLVVYDAAVVRRRADGAWPIATRVALGFRPSVGARDRPLALAPDGREVIVVDRGRAHRVALAPRDERVQMLEAEDVVAAHFVPAGLALSRWSDEVAETLFPDGEQAEALPFAVLATSPDRRTWLVADKPRGPRPLALRLVDAATRAPLGAVPLEGAGEEGSSFLTASIFSPDGRHLVTVESGRTGHVRDARTGKRLQRIDLYAGDRMIGAAFRPDGRYLVTAGRRAGADVRREAVLLWRLREEAALPTWHERLRAALYERVAPDGSVWGRDALDPLLCSDTMHVLAGRAHEETLAVLDAFLAAEAPLSDLERALIQRDLWAVYDWVVGAHRLPPGVVLREGAEDALSERLADAIAKVALDVEAIAALPDTFARAVAAEVHPAAWDPERPLRPFLPPTLLDPEGAWVCLGDAGGRFLAPFHLRKRDGRAAFSVHVRLPGGRAATEAWVENAREAIAAHAGEVGAPVPDPPRGTRFGLVRRALLVDRGGRVRPSPLIERVQLRVHASQAGTDPLGRAGREDAAFEWNLDARRLLAGTGTPLVPVAELERDFVLEPHSDPFETRAERFRPPLPTLRACSVCHAAHMGPARIHSLTHAIGPTGPLPRALEPSTPAREADLFVRWKAARR